MKSLTSLSLMTMFIVATILTGCSSNKTSLDNGTTGDKTAGVRLIDLNNGKTAVIITASVTDPTLKFDKIKVNTNNTDTAVVKVLFKKGPSDFNNQGLVIGYELADFSKYNDRENQVLDAYFPTEDGTGPNQNMHRRKTRKLKADEQ